MTRTVHTNADQSADLHNAAAGTTAAAVFLLARGIGVMEFREPAGTGGAAAGVFIADLAGCVGVAAIDATPALVGRECTASYCSLSLRWYLVRESRDVGHHNYVCFFLFDVRREERKSTIYKGCLRVLTTKVLTTTPTTEKIICSDLKLPSVTVFEPLQMAHC
jgi:hypothetical protein